MAMLAGVRGHGDGSAIGAESSGQRFERGDFQMRMIDGQEHRGLSFGWNQSQSTLERAEHASIRIWIDGEQDNAAALDAGSDLLGVVSDDDDDWIANGGEETDETIEKRFVLKLEQRFGSAHAAGSAAGENDASDLRSTCG